MSPTRREVIAAMAGSIFAAPSAMAQGGDNLSRLRMFAESIPPQQWKNVPGTALASVVPPRAMMPNDGAVSGPASVLSAWNGAAYDPGRHHMYFWGGGHTDYGGNEVYDLDLGQLKISRLTDPSPLTANAPAGQNAQCKVPADGTPLSAHDYDGIAWCPLTNSFWIWPAIGYCLIGEIGFNGACWEFDPTVKKWKQGPQAPIAGYFSAAWVPTHKKFLLCASARTCWFDPIAKVYSAPSSPAADYGDLTSCYVEHRNEVWFAWSGMLRVHPSEPVPGPLEPIIDPRNMIARGGMTYDPVNKMILFWSGGAATAALNPDTLEWRVFGSKPNTPAPAQVHPVYSKWKYIAEVGCCVGYNDINEGLWLWKPGQLSQAPVYKEYPSFVVQNADGSGARTFVRANEAAQSVKDGQTIRILKNPNGPVTGGLAIRANNVRIVGDAGAQIQGAVVDGVGLIAGYGNDLTVENLEIFNVRGDGSASGIRFNGRNFTGRNLKIHDCDMGFLSAGKNGIITLEDVELSDCGAGTGGQAHNVYVSENAAGAPDQFIFRRSRSFRARNEGHLLKSRALATTIEGSILAMQDANSSRCIDISDGGVVIIRGNVIQQGPNADNEEIIGIALELTSEKLNPSQHRENSTIVEDNIVISDFVSGTIGLVHTRSPNTVTVTNNEIVTAVSTQNFLVAYPDISAQRGKVDNKGDNQITRGREQVGFKPLPWLPNVRTK